MPCSLSAIQAAACLSGIGKEQNRLKLLQWIAQLSCEIAEAGGGGGGADAMQGFSGNYGGGAPTQTPTTSVAIAYDTSNGTEWHWYDGAWH